MVIPTVGSRELLEIYLLNKTTVNQFEKIGIVVVLDVLLEM